LLLLQFVRHAQRGCGSGHREACADVRCASVFRFCTTCVRPLSQTASPGAKPPRGGTPAKAPAPAPPPAALPTIRIASPVCARGSARSGAHPSHSHTHGHTHTHAPLSLLSGTRLDFSSPPGAHAPEDAPAKVTSPVAAASVADLMASFGFFSPRPGLVVATAEAAETPEFALAAAQSELVGLSAQLAARSETADALARSVGALAELATERAAHAATRAAAALAREAADAAEARAAAADAAADAAKAAADTKQASLLDEVCVFARTQALTLVHTHGCSGTYSRTRGCFFFLLPTCLLRTAAWRAGGDARGERGGRRVPRGAAHKGG
jgi:hypothetical protein